MFIHPGKHVLFRANRRLAAACLLLAAIAVGGCDSDLSLTSAEGTIDRVAVVVNRGDRTLTIIPFAPDASSRTVLLGNAGAPADLAVRNDRALVPMDGGLLVVDLTTGTIMRRIPLVPGQEGQRVAFVSDTLVLVASHAAGSLTPVNPQSGRVSVSTAAVGAAPLEMIQGGGRVYVLGSAPGVAPSVVVLDSLLRRISAVPLSGVNPRAMVMRGNLLYVLHAGEPGTAGGALSIVDTGAGRETAYVQGFGQSPESLAFNSRGELFVTIPGRGLIVFNPATRAFTPGPEAPLTAGGLDRVTRVAADPAGFVYALQPGACDRPGALVRLNVDGSAATSVATGICPAEVEFTALPRR